MNPSAFQKLAQTVRQLSPPATLFNYFFAANQARLAEINAKTSALDLRIDELRARRDAAISQLHLLDNDHRATGNTAPAAAQEVAS